MSDHEEQFTEAAQERDTMQSLIEHPGWKLIEECLKVHIVTRTNILEEPLESGDLVYKQEYTKGARQAFRLILEMPSSIIETSEAVINAINTEKDNEDGGDPDDGNGNVGADDDDD